MNISRNKYFFLIIFIFFSKISFSQFENNGMRKTSSEFEIDLLQDTQNTYLKIMLIGDIFHSKDLFLKTTRDNYNNISYRSWFRQIKPILQFSDISIAGLRTSFPDNNFMNSSNNGSPDEFIGELMYSGFDVLAVANNNCIEEKSLFNKKTLNKIDNSGMLRVGAYHNQLDKNKFFPLVLEKKDIRIGIFNYTVDSLLIKNTNTIVNFFNLDSIALDVQKAENALVDYKIVYIDWNNLEDSIILKKNVELYNLGFDIIIGNGNKGLNTVNLINLKDNNKKLMINNLGFLNSDTNSRNTNKSALIELVLKKNNATKIVNTHDLGFIPIWTLNDNTRYSVLPVSNIEERHIKNINVNYLQYSDMKICLTDLRYNFFDKIPELHYDFNDKIVNDVEHTSYLRNTILKETEKNNETFKENALEKYMDLFNVLPPNNKQYVIPYEDNLKIYTPKISKQITYDPDLLKIDSADLNLETGISVISSNKEYYTREKKIEIIYTEEEKRKMDSIKNYEERFFSKDTLQEYKEKLKQQKRELKRVKDSIYLANFDSNYISKAPLITEPSSKIPEYIDKSKDGIFTITKETSDKSPIKEIEEYFVIEFLTKEKPIIIDIKKFPFLKGYEIQKEGNLYHYYINKTNSLSLSLEIYKSIVDKGFKDAKHFRITDNNKVEIKD